MVITLPTWLTLARIALIPPVALLLLADTALAYWAATVLFGLAALTDWADGRLARELGATTALGRCLDPIADKLLVATVLIVLLWQGTAPLVPVLLILVRELAVSGLREALAGDGPALPVTQLAKWKTTTQMVALGLLCVGPALTGATLVGSLLLWVAAVLTTVSGAQYLRAGLAQLAATSAPET